MTSGFEWVVSPDVIGQGLDDFGAKALAAVQAAATYWGQSVQDAAREDAKWQDRTGNARGGLFFAVDGFGFAPIIGEVTPEAKREMSDTTVESGVAHTLIITLGHTVFYGKYLEASNGETYAIVLSTIHSNLPDLERMLQDIFRG